MLWNPHTSTNVSQVPQVEQAAKALGIAFRSFPVSSPEDLKVTFGKVVQEKAAALYVAGDAMIFDLRSDVITFSVTDRIPSMHIWPEEAFDGAVAAYGTELSDQQGGTFANAQDDCSLVV
jgi:ABC-type uncharacterized transport system substrate-binding protein